MIDLGLHGKFILAAYLVAGGGLLGLVAWAIIDRCAQVKALARMTAQATDDASVPVYQSRYDHAA